jgi:hypothetical protein
MLSFSLFSWKTLVGAGAALALVGGGVVAASAATTEDDFGQQVKQEVIACKATAARTDTHGIGHCVSAWVTAHNPSNSASPEPSESPKAEPSEKPDVDQDANEPADTEPSTSVKPSPGAHHGGR